MDIYKEEKEWTTYQMAHSIPFPLPIRTCQYSP